MLVVGLTGGIATGKSTVAAIFEKLGAYRIDTDQLARYVVEPGQPGLTAIVRHFGQDVIAENGQLNRKKLATLIFQNKEQRQVLESITHPLIHERLEAELSAANARGERVVLLEVPLLFEVNFHQGVDRIVVVAVDEETQLSRLMQRDGFTPTEAKQRVSAQLPLIEKAARAHYVINNSGTLDQTEQQVQQIWQKLLQGCKNG